MEPAEVELNEPPSLACTSPPMFLLLPWETLPCQVPDPPTPLHPQPPLLEEILHPVLLFHLLHGSPGKSGGGSAGTPSPTCLVSSSGDGQEEGCVMAPSTNTAARGLDLVVIAVAAR
jgi:hypothetical protein